MEGYQVKFYINSQTKEVPLIEYLDVLNPKVRAKILKYIDFLRERKGYLDEPYSRHIMGKIRELRVDFARDKHRIFYFVFVGRKIILLHGFTKKTQKTPRQEINKAIKYYHDVNNNWGLYE